MESASDQFRFVSDVDFANLANNGMTQFSRVWSMPSSRTFDCKPIREFVLRYLKSPSVDPFAGDARIATYNNDINPHKNSDNNYDAEEFLSLLHQANVKAKTVILDPPYSPRQIAECYKDSGLKVEMTDTQNSRLYKRVREAARKICEPGTVVMSFGWNSCGMGDGFEIIEIMLVAHGGAHNDTICMAERCLATQPNLMQSRT